MSMVNAMLENVQSLVEGLMRNKEYKGFKVSNLSRYELCTACNKEIGNYSGRNITTDNFNEMLSAAAELYNELTVKETTVMESAEDSNIISIQHLGYTEVSECRKCKSNKNDEESVNMFELLNEKEIKKLLKSDLQEYAIRLQHVYMVLEAKLDTAIIEKELAEGTMEPIKEEPKTNNEEDVKMTVQPKYSKEQLEAMREAAINGGTTVPASTSNATIKYDINSDVAKSVLFNIAKKNGKWASANQSSYMRHRAVKAVPAGIEVLDKGFVIGFTNNASVDYFVCDSAGIYKQYRVTGKDIKVVWDINKKKEAALANASTLPRLAATINDVLVVVDNVKKSGDLVSGVVKTEKIALEFQWNTKKYALPRVMNAKGNKATNFVKQVIGLYLKSVEGQAQAKESTPKQQVANDGYQPIIDDVNNVAFDPSLYE